MQTSTTVEDVADLAALSPAVRWGRAAHALARILENPQDTERVLAFSSLVNAGGNVDRIRAFYDDPRGKKLYDERRAIDSHSVDLDALEQLPADTLGHAYATFMKSHGLTPNIFDGSPAEIRDPHAAYIVQRLRQTHDLWHVVTNAQTDPAGEVALQAFTYAQLGAPSAGILAAAGSLRALRHTRAVLHDALVLFRVGCRAEKLAMFPWEDHWATPLAEVRRLLGLPTDPQPIGGYAYEYMAA